MGCTRPENASSKISIKTPGAQAIRAAAAFPPGKKVCYGVNVTGVGIVGGAGLTCSGSGISAGFVPENSELIVEVPKGSKREFELFVFLAEPADNCPEFSTSLDKLKLFSTGKAVADTEAAEMSLEIQSVFPGATNSLATLSCNSPSGLKAKLMSNGDLLDAGDVLLAASSPVAEGAWTSPFADSLGVGVLSSGGYVNIASDNLKIPDSVFSVTRKPDDGLYYGLQHDGQIVKLVRDGSEFQMSAVAAGACPFAVTNCQVPVWMQSISAGYGTELYGLDHGGGIHKLTATGPVETGVSVDPSVSQVSYY